LVITKTNQGSREFILDKFICGDTLLKDLGG